MPSPFPGMNPYLERSWSSVHGAFIFAAQAALNESLPPDLVARSERRVIIDDPDEGVSIDMRPDVDVVEERPVGGGGVGGGGGRQPSAAAVIDAPYVLLPPDPPPVERYLSVSDADGRLLAAIEFVSPSNKADPGLTRFRRNRDALLGAGVNVVEIDLVRAGNWRALMAPDRCPPRAASAYRAVVRTAGIGGQAYLFPIGLRDPLPDVPVPLAADRPPATLPLAALLATVHHAGRYGRPGTYAHPPDPPLDAADAAWAAELLAGRESP